MKTLISLTYQPFIRRNALLGSLLATTLLFGFLNLPGEIFRLLVGSLLTLALFRAALAMMPRPESDQGWRYQLKVINNSNYAIHKLYISSSEEYDRGPDQLRFRVLEPNGSQFILTGIAPGRYNIRVVDEGGDSCVVRGVRIYGNSTWNVRNSEALRCARFGQSNW